MIKEALEFLASIQTPHSPSHVHIDGQPYALNEDGTIADPILPLPPPFTKPTFEVASLSGLVALVQNKVDSFPASAALHISTPFLVNLVDLEANDKGQRHIYAQAKHISEMAFEFNKYYEPEPFIIAFRASFLFNDMAVNVQRLCSSLTAGQSVTTDDDGISQTVRTE